MIMNRWIAGLAVVIMTTVVQAAEFSGKLTAIEPSEEGLGLEVTIDGSQYLLLSTSAVLATRADGRVQALPSRLLKPGLWVTYELSNESGEIGSLKSLNVTGPAGDIQQIIKAIP